jgi:Spy/CpxP family protein refolding chaperone
MRRTYITALAMALSFASVSAAAAQDREAPRAERGMRGPGQMGGLGRGLLRDITLNDTQKEQLKAIHTKYQQQTKAVQEQMKPIREELQAARKANDTAKLQSLRESVKAPMQQMNALRQQELSEVRAILTADQQKQLDTNLARMKERGAKQMENRRERGDRGARRTR